MQLGGVRAEELRDGGAERDVAGHDVERAARGVLAVVVPPAVRRDLREGVAHRAVDVDGVGGEPALDPGSGHGAIERPGADAERGLSSLEVAVGDPAALAGHDDLDAVAGLRPVTST